MTNATNISYMRASFVAVLMAMAAVATAVVRPAAPIEVAAPDLDQLLPEKIDEWRRIPLSDAVLPAEASLLPGEAVAYRAYRNTLGRVVTLVVAYGPPLGDSVRLHRPERCYTAQGFQISRRRISQLTVDDQKIATVHMLAQNPTRNEAVSYWLRSGPSFMTHAQFQQFLLFKRGIAQPLDGALIRVSTKGADAAQFAIHEEFLRAFYNSLSQEAAVQLLDVDGRGGARS
ncbi:MAG: exosortase C-terminal domain/associated protein EpsI [Pseudomonadota bacterium]